MKDWFFGLVLIIVLVLVAWFASSAIGQRDRNLADQTVDIDFFKFDLTGETGMVWRLWSDDRPVATHFFKTGAISGMTWLKNPDQGSRSSFWVGGKEIYHNLTFDEFIVAMEQAKKEVDGKEMPSLLELSKTWKSEPPK